MGFRLQKKWGIFLTLAAVLILCGIGVAVYYYKMGKVSLIPSSPSSNVSSVATPNQDKEIMSGDDPNVNELNGTVVCVGSPFNCDIRLDPNVVPIHYELYLNPNVENGTFEGTVSITLKIGGEVDHIRLHAKYLTINETLLYHGLDQVKLKKSFEVPEKEYWVIIPESTLQRSRYNLTMTFNGSLTKGLTGFYRSSYFDSLLNDTKFVVSTKFQPTSARKAFPCFDEPSFKSTFTLTLVKPENLTALSNMPVFQEIPATPSEGLTTVKFKKSEKMVTYLVVVAIGDFASIDGQTKRGLPVRVFATKSNVNKTAYAAEIAPKMIDFFEDYFEVPFPLPKLDIIGIPDFISGAMEHWGLVSFRESNLLYQPGVAAASNKQRIATVVAHEFAHMWFGNLVTMKWWDDLYLNEGFASFMEYKGVQAVHPDWEIESQFVSSDLAPVLQLDGKLSSHPIVQEVKSPDQITEIFDTISYNKGSSVLRMLESFMTPAKFRHGITQFLEEFSLKNAQTEDLWDFLQAEVNPASNINISLIMDTWTRQMNYPLVTVEINDGVVKLSQERFVESMKNSKMANTEKPSPFNYTWEIPMQIFTSNDIFANSTLHWIRHTEKSIEIPVDKATTWVKVNSGQFGYFRVNFPESMWKELKNVYHTNFLPEERCGLLDDSLALANAEYLSYDVALDFITVAASETHFVPWSCLYSHLKELSHLLASSVGDAYVLYRKLVTKLTSNLYNSFYWIDNESAPHLERLLKNMIFDLSCENGYPNCLVKTKELFENFIRNPYNNTIPSDLRGIVYEWGMSQSNETVWDLIWERYLLETDAQEKVRLLNCLASTRESWIIQRLIERAKKETNVRRQDFFTLMKFVARNPIGNPILWKFYRGEYKQLVKRFSINDRYFGRMILDIVSDYSSQSQLQEIREFFKTYPEAGAGKRAREISVEKVQNNIEWLSKNSNMVESWLKMYFN